MEAGEEDVIEFRDHGHYDKAIALSQKVLQERRQALGNEHVDTLNIAALLADVLSQNAQYDEAEHSLRHLLERSKQLHGDNHTTTLRITLRLGATLVRGNKWNDGQSTLESILGRCKQVLGPNHEITLDTMQNLAWAYTLKKEKRRALSLLRETLEGRICTSGLDHIYTLSAKRLLGTALAALGEYDEAEKLYNAALQRSMAQWGEEDFNTTMAMALLSLFKQRRGNMAEALDLGMRALKTSQRVLGEDHVWTVWAMMCPIIPLQMARRSHEAIAMANDCLEKAIRVFGKTHNIPMVAVSYLDLLPTEGVFQQTLARDMCQNTEEKGPVSQERTVFLKWRPLNALVPDPGDRAYDRLVELGAKRSLGHWAVEVRPEDLNESEEGRTWEIRSVADAQLVFEYTSGRWESPVTRQKQRLIIPEKLACGKVYMTDEEIDIIARTVLKNSQTSSLSVTERLNTVPIKFASDLPLALPSLAKLRKALEDKCTGADIDMSIINFDILFQNCQNFAKYLALALCGNTTIGRLRVKCRFTKLLGSRGRVFATLRKLNRSGLPPLD